MFIDILLILKQFVTSLETVFVKFYQDFIVLLVVVQPPTHLVSEKLALLTSPFNASSQQNASTTRCGEKQCFL